MDIPIPRYEQEASIRAITEQLDKSMPGWARGMIKPDMIAFMSYTALEAAAQARHDHDKAVKPPAPDSTHLKAMLKPPEAGDDDC